METDYEMEGLDPVEEHGYAIGGQEETDDYNLAEGENEFIVRPRPTPSPLITDSVSVRHPIGMDYGWYIDPRAVTSFPGGE